MVNKSSNVCGHCNNFTLNQNDIQLIPNGSCGINNISGADYHSVECGNFDLKFRLQRTINCNGCHFELWPEYECKCIRNYTAEHDNFHIAVK